MSDDSPKVNGFAGGGSQGQQGITGWHVLSKVIDRSLTEVVTLGVLAIFAILVWRWPEDKLPEALNKVTTGPLCWTLLLISIAGFLILLWSFHHMRSKLRATIDRQADRVRKFEREKQEGRLSSSEVGEDLDGGHPEAQS